MKFRTLYIKCKIRFIEKRKRIILEKESDRFINWRIPFRIRENREWYGNIKDHPLTINHEIKLERKFRLIINGN